MARDDAPLRLAHVSDIHVTVPRPAWKAEDWLSKRLTTWINHRLLGRGRRFRRAEEVLTALHADLDARRPDLRIFSGDATAMGFEEEMARAAELLGVGRRPGLAVPGNHDYCTVAARRGGHFERCFADWQAGERVGGEVYPFARRVGGVWLVAVNSATPNRWPWDARGAVGPAQLSRLEQLLGRLDGPRVLITHYPVALPGGRPEGRSHGLRDLRGLLDVAARGGVALWLHGHRHDAYYHPAGALAPFPVLCAGSATQTGLWSYGEYTLHAGRLTAGTRVFDPAAGGFREGASFVLDLPQKVSAARR
jgi:3',5'-cyclic AMP phosphodiesterase CpdA